MDVRKCVNGHFFDGDKYSECPHCGAAAALDTPLPEKSKSTEKRHFWEKKKTESDVQVICINDRTMGTTFGVFNDGIGMDGIKAQEPSEEADVPYKGLEKRNEEPEIHPRALKTREKARQPETDSLADAVKSVASGSNGKTVGFFNAGTSEAETEPVVGWLVCIKGNHFGECFHIAAGRNSIGRGENNKMVIMKDTAVSRDKHAWITYEPKKREFFIQPGESSGLSYLNGENIMESKKIKAYDKLEFGNGIYLFLPLCGDNFSWEEYMED